MLVRGQREVLCVRARVASRSTVDGECARMCMTLGTCGNDGLDGRVPLDGEQLAHGTGALQLHGDLIAVDALDVLGKLVDVHANGLLGHGVGHGGRVLAVAL